MLRGLRPGPMARRGSAPKTLPRRCGVMRPHACDVAALGSPREHMRDDLAKRRVVPRRRLELACCAPATNKSRWLASAGMKPCRTRGVPQQTGRALVASTIRPNLNQNLRKLHPGSRGPLSSAFALEPLKKAPKAPTKYTKSKQPLAHESAAAVDVQCGLAWRPNR